MLPINPELMVINGWKATPAEKDGDGSVALTLRRKPGVTYYSAFQVRSEFLEIEGLNGACQFFEKYGPLYSPGVSERQYSMKQVIKLKEEIRKTRELSPRDYFISKSNDWNHFFETFPISGRLVMHQVPRLYVESENVLEALRSATYLDQIAGVRAASCKHCGRQFSWGPKDKKKTFCSLEHQRAHSKDKWNQVHGKGRYAKAAK